MHIAIFSGKKSQIASRKIVFYIIAAVVISIAFLLLVFIIPSQKSNIAIIPSGLENYLLTQRFFNSPSCFAFQDEKTDRAYPWIIDLAKFDQNNLDKCYGANSRDLKAYRLTLGYSKSPTEPVMHPILDDFSSTCKNICNKQGKKCILGADDGKENKKCTDSFVFEGNDDYCLCGESDKLIPSPASDFHDTCTNICGAKGCIKGIDDGNTFKACGDSFRFEKNQNDDYCICGKLESTAPNRDDFDATCDTICKDKGKNCASGIDDGSTAMICNTAFRFEGYDDYCICEDDSIDEKITINTKNWGGFLKKAETFDIFVYDKGTIQKAKLKIEVQDAE